MIYSEPLRWQLNDFFLFFGFGFLAGLLFCVFEFLRKLFSSSKRAVFVQDIGFCVAATVLFFLSLLVYANGVLRLNFVFAAALGAVVYFLTLGRAVRPALQAFSTAFSVLIKAVTAPIVGLEKLFASVCSRAFVAIKAGLKRLFPEKRETKPKNDEKNIKKSRRKRKKDLKNLTKSL